MFGKLFPKQIGFFDLFDRHAEATLGGLKLIHQCMQTWPGSMELVARVEEVEHQCDSFTHMTVDLMRRSYITPFDRDEIRHLISRMDDVIDQAQGASTRLKLFEIQQIPEEMVRMSAVLVAAQSKIVEGVKELRNLKKAKTLQTLCREIHSLENEGDALHHQGLAKLLNGSNDPILVIKLKEIYSMLEQSTDCCEDVANALEGLLIEHAG